MKHLSRAILAVFMAVLMGTLLPVQVFADTPDYISEVKVFEGDYSSAQTEGYTILCQTDANGNLVKDKKGNTIPVDLNQKAGGGLGSKGEKSVYLGYKTTKNSKDAITDLAVMNMKGGYSVKDYKYLIKTYMDSQIIPFVKSFTVAITEYRENCNSENEANRQRAEHIRAMLNKLTDDDCGGAGLGDLLLNETKYEMGDEAYNKLSDAEKKKHADIVTIITQANGQATLTLENLITRATDSNDDIWLERLTNITYDDLVESTDMTPTDAEKQLAKLYDDDAQIILNMWDNFSEQLNSYDEISADVEAYNISEFNEAKEALNHLSENSTEEEISQAYSNFTKVQTRYYEIMQKAELLGVHDYLSETDYNDGTLLDLFSMTREEVEDDGTLIYPIVASLTAGQRAGLDFVSLEELCAVAITAQDGYENEIGESIATASVYEGVDRGIYEEGGVALTSDAIRSKVEIDPVLNKGISGLSIASWAITGACLIGAVSSFVAMRYASNVIKELDAQHEILLGLYKENGELGRLKDATLSDVRALNPEAGASFSRATGNYTLCKSLAIGFSVAIVVFTAISVYLTWQDMKAYYKVDFAPIPNYIVEENDIIGYNKKGEKIILKNQSAYYKAVECNRSESDEFYNVLGTKADMNGDVGKQWLALYAVKKELMEPILASSLKVVVDSVEIPAGYDTGIHMFGADTAFNLNNSLYDWANDAPSVYVYFKTDDTAKASATGSTFTGGTLALAGCAGIAVGALGVLVATKATTKRKDNAEATA